MTTLHQTVTVPRVWTAKMREAARNAPVRAARRTSLTDIQDARIEEHWEAALAAAPEVPPPANPPIELGRVGVVHDEVALTASVDPHSLPPGQYVIYAVRVGD